MSTPASLAKDFQDLLNIMKPDLRERIEAVFQSFDVVALAKRATSVMEKEEATSVLRIAQGGYNSILAVIFIDGTDVLVRLAGSYHNAPLADDELAALVFEAEVATLKFLEANTSIPVPKVYHSNSDAKEVGARYMIMERLNGVPVDNAWHSMSHEQRQDVVTQWALMQAELSKQKFNAIGSLTKAGAVGPLLPSSLAEYALRKPHWGPFSSTPDFLAGHACSALEGLAAHTDKANFLERLLRAIRALPRDKFDNERLVLSHDDLSPGNILYAPPSKIVGVIDWEGSSVLPIWAAFQHGDFLSGAPDEAALREIMRPTAEDTGLPAALHPLLRELLSLATGVEDPGLTKLRACVTELAGSFTWVTKPFLSLMEE